MPILLGNSGSPRWYDGRFDEYLAHLVEWGATSVELPVHHGEYDERTARVHLLQPNWEGVIGAYRGSRLAVQLHVSLDPRFATDRWLFEPVALEEEFEPVLRLHTELAVDQPVAVLVVHGAADPNLSLDDNERATVGVLDWLSGQLTRPSQRVTVELTAASPLKPTAACRSRESLTRVVEQVASEQIGICWDLAHDCENAGQEPGWTSIPAERFLRRVGHVHLHDMDAAGEDHYPLVMGRVPYAEQLASLAGLSGLPPITMEVRWRCAERLGRPWDLLGESYRTVWETLESLVRA